MTQFLLVLVKLVDRRLAGGKIFGTDNYTEHWNVCGNSHVSNEYVSMKTGVCPPAGGPHQ